MNYQGKHVLVLGLGESGLAMAQWLVHCGAIVRVADTRAVPQRLQALRTLLPEVSFIGGVDAGMVDVTSVTDVGDVDYVGDDIQVFSPALLDGIDFVALSPGLAPACELALVLPAAQQRNIPVWGEIELFAQALAVLRTTRAYTPKVIAITGTNGKTTVTRLTGLLCQHAGLTVQVAGNISPAVLEVLRKVLEEDALPQVWVLELSSFQLHTTYSLDADTATVLNISQDHLDWHGSMDAYVADKARIFGPHTARVLNREDESVMQMASTSSSFSSITTFGLREPAQVGCFGLRNEGGIAWLCVAEQSEQSEQAVQHLMPVDGLKIRGQHNAMNALAALALCRAIDLPFAPLLAGLREYQGEPHRVELVTTIAGVAYYDDSKGTNVGATVAALNGLGVMQYGSQQRQGHLILIAGGDGKGQDFEPLIAPVQRYVRAVFLIGKDAPILRVTLEKSGVPLLDCTNLEHAVQGAAEIAQEGDAVLLSPACASLDMFQNYVHRAQVFVDAVREVALSRGEVMA